MTARRVMTELRDTENEISKDMNDISLASHHGFVIPFDKLESANVPQVILELLRHDHIQRLRESSKRRKEINTAIKEAQHSLKLEDDPDLKKRMNNVNRRGITNLLNSYKEAEDNLLELYQSYEGSLYQSAYEKLGTAIAAIDKLVSNEQLEKTKELDEAKNILSDMQTHCRFAYGRHSSWLFRRFDLKNKVNKLAKELGVHVDNDLLKTPDLQLFMKNETQVRTTDEFDSWADELLSSISSDEEEEPISPE